MVTTDTDAANYTREASLTSERSVACVSSKVAADHELEREFAKSLQKLTSTEQGSLDSRKLGCSHLPSGQPLFMLH